MKNFQQEGDVLTLTAPSGGVVSGGFYQIGQLLVVAAEDADQDDPFQAKRTGVFTTTVKTTSQAWAEGAVLYWTGSAFTTTASGNLRVGFAAAEAGSADTTGTVFLDGIATPDAS